MFQKHVNATMYSLMFNVLGNVLIPGCCSLISSNNHSIVSFRETKTVFKLEFANKKK